MMLCLRDSADFQDCIDAVKNNDISVKKLAIQIVLRFFDDFPDKRAAALNTLMSQLRNPDVEVHIKRSLSRSSSLLHYCIPF
ncbi:hypothetical protein COOONC_23983 [Cooperia oncophora]